ncbi:MAG: ABC transporter permease, partial [Chloroflexi bacterium]|nr:ABC transporter permease [Chloroflexota bacterium]
MARYIFSRLVQSILLMLGVLVIVFFMTRLTGDPVSLMVPKEAPAEMREEFRKAHGFDRPLYQQFFSYMGGVARGDLGESLKFREPSLDLILQRLGPTIYLATVSMVLAILVAVPIGIIGGYKPGSIADSLGRALGLFGQAIPGFVLALLFILIFAVRLGWFPSFGRDQLSSIVLPAVALSIGSMGQLVRLTRSAVLEIRNEDYIRTARSKGLSSRLVGSRHIARNAALALISVITILYTYSLGGTIYIESIFAWPGIGN